MYGSKGLMLTHIYPAHLFHDQSSYLAESAKHIHLGYFIRVSSLLFHFFIKNLANLEELGIAKQ